MFNEKEAKFQRGPGGRSGGARGDQRYDRNYDNNRSGRGPRNMFIDDKSTNYGDKSNSYGDKTHDYDNKSNNYGDQKREDYGSHRRTYQRDQRDQRGQDRNYTDRREYREPRDYKRPRDESFGQYNKEQRKPFNRQEDCDENGDSHDEAEQYLNQPSVKQQLLSYIYSTVEIGKYKYKILEYEHDLVALNGGSYFVSPNYNGINGLMVFMRIRDRFFSFIVDRRTLSYNLNQLDMSKVKIMPIHVRLNKQIYDGTIIDGVLLYNHKNSWSKTFVINDIYSFCGKNLLEDFMNHKMTNITTFMDASHVKDDKLNSVNFFINKLYALNEIRELVNSYIPKSNYSNSIKGLTFYPKQSGTKLIYLYNNCSNSKIGETSPQAVQLVTPVEVRESNVEVRDSFVSTFRMKKKETVDVYQLYLYKKVVKDGKNYMKFEKFDMAYIPTKDCSFFCKDLFEKSGTDTVLVQCKYLPDSKKWIPFKEADKKKPDSIDKVRAKLGEE